MTTLTAQPTSVQTTQTTAETAHNCTRGSWQRSIVDDMLVGSCVSPVSQLRGRAKNYAGHYQESFDNLLGRLRRAGITVDRTPGPRGGEYSATYTIR